MTQALQLEMVNAFIQPLQSLGTHIQGVTLIALSGPTKKKFNTIGKKCQV